MMSENPQASQTPASVDERSATTPDDRDAAASPQRVRLLGKLGGVTKREAQRMIRDAGGIVCDSTDTNVDLIVLGAEDYALGDAGKIAGELLGELREAVRAGRTEVISETEWWQRMGATDPDLNIRRLYTPAMLAELLEVPIRVIRRWHRRELIVPVKEVHRLPYFDFQEVATARQLARMLGAGVSAATIEKNLAELARFVPDVERPLSQLSIIVEGRKLLLRQGEGLIEPGGQMRFDFDSAAFTDLPESEQTGGLGDNESSSDSCDRIPATISLLQAVGQGSQPRSDEELEVAEILELAADSEDHGRIDEATELYRAALAAKGPDANICFQLAELLYRLGDLTAARERYFTAIEIDEDYVEARANLGCVLAELGQFELAVAAFQGALAYHNDYPDVHYHLARTLDELGESDESRQHWQEFVKLAPDSPWADEAKDRLQ